MPTEIVSERYVKMIFVTLKIVSRSANMDIGKELSLL
jgi:hypothetical protein